MVKMTIIMLREGLFIIKRTLRQHWCGWGEGLHYLSPGPTSRTPLVSCEAAAVCRDASCLLLHCGKCQSLSAGAYVPSFRSLKRFLRWSHGFIRLSSVQTANQRPDPDPENTLFVEEAFNKQKRDRTQDDNVSETN